MINIGTYNTLRIDRIQRPGAFLEDEEGNDVLLPHKYLLQHMSVDDYVKVFVYKDNMGRPIATTLEPYVTVGNFASLEVQQVTDHGCFLDLGIEKGVLLPFREQRMELKAGEKTVIYMYLDKQTERLVATHKYQKFLEPYTEEQSKDAMSALIAERSPIGYKCIVDGKYSGLLYKNELKRSVNIGDELDAYIKRVREDGKLDLQLEAIGFSHAQDFSDTLLDRLKENDGHLALHDKSDPDLIRSELGVSKKVFKQAVGQLYKQRKIEINKDGIRLL